MVEKGYITVEDLDTPSPGFIANTAVDRHHFPCGYPGLTYRNLLRDPDPEPSVQLSEPRDFTPTEGATPAQPLDLPLTPEELDW
jgi:hypothetical protein